MFENEAIYPLLGYLLGEMAGDQVAAITGIPQNIKIDSLKGFCAAAASSGAVGLFHMVGITPEAHTLEMCLHGNKPENVYDITPKLIKKAEALDDAKRCGRPDCYRLPALLTVRVYQADPIDKGEKNPSFCGILGIYEQKRLCMDKR
jgi:predicted aconitase